MFWNLALRYVLVVALLGASVPAMADEESTSFLWKAGLATSIGLIYATNLFRADSAGIEVGYGDKIWIQRGFFRWEGREAALGRPGGLSVDILWQGAYGHWRSSEGGEENNSLSFAPVFRINLPWRWTPDYVETWVGVAALSTSEIGGRRLGVHVQFEDVLAVGWRLGRAERWDLSLRQLHHSNNDISLENDGVTLHFVSLSYRY